MKALVITPQGQQLVQEYSSFGDLQKLVGGYIERVPFTDTTVAYVNEEGKLENLPQNLLATHLCWHYRVGLSPDDVIAGNFVIVGILNEQGEDDGEEHDIPESLVEEIKRLCQ